MRAEPRAIALAAMDLADIDQVVEIDRLSFPLPWSAGSYRREITENDHSHFFVAYLPDDAADNNRWWSRWINPVPARRIVGYIGYWHVADEAHVSTIAVHPDYREQRVGERMLAHMLRHAQAGGATLATLEVRESNLSAQRLYHKYGFEVVGKRKRYYRDNGEDAEIMSVSPIASAWQKAARWESLAMADSINHKDGRDANE